MSRTWIKNRKQLQWRMECLGHSVIEVLAGMLPGSWAFRMGEWLGAAAWHFMPLRRRVVLRNLRIAFAGEKDPPEIRRLARENFRRTGGNLVSAAHTARLPVDRLPKVIRIENIGLLENAMAAGRGVVLLLAHMGNWEILSRLIHLFPRGSRTGAFYRPLNNPLLDERVLARRQADGTRMFSKRDPFHQVSGFLREGGIVGILADQRVGWQGELVSFFGRLTRASPLPSLLARRSKSTVLALSLVTERPGCWKARFIPVGAPPDTPHCMTALETAMKADPADVFWMQERWRVYARRRDPLIKWLGPANSLGEKPCRVLVWLAGVPDSWQMPADWNHPEVEYEIAVTSPRNPPPWMPAATRVHVVPSTEDRESLQKTIAMIDESAILPVDFILAIGASKALLKAGRREAVPVVSLP